MKIEEIKNKKGTIYIKIKEYENNYICAIGWDYGPKNRKNEIPSILNEKFANENLAILKEIENNILWIRSIKNKGRSTKELLKDLLNLHQEISQKIFIKQTLF